MGKNHIDNLLDFCQKLYSKLEMIDTIIILTKSYYSEKEAYGKYYNLPREFSIHISQERTHCINMLTILSEHIEESIELNEAIEREVHLHNDTNNCS